MKNYFGKITVRRTIFVLLALSFIFWVSWYVFVASSPFFAMQHTNRSVSLNYIGNKRLIDSVLDSIANSESITITNGGASVGFVGGGTSTRYDATDDVIVRFCEHLANNAHQSKTIGGKNYKTIPALAVNETMFLQPSNISLMYHSDSVSALVIYFPSVDGAVYVSLSEKFQFSRK